VTPPAELSSTRITTSEELAHAHAIRHEVFVIEQRVPVDVERDGLDDQASHVLLRCAARPVATGRVRQTAKGYKLERVAVLAEFRERAIGARLVGEMLALVPSGAPVYLHAQEGALGFWQKLGFVSEGPAFVEGGIRHRFMHFRASGSTEAERQL
jgi:predicted GNAT family N-acyltransferase